MECMCTGVIQYVPLGESGTLGWVSAPGTRRRALGLDPEFGQFRVETRIKSRVPARTGGEGDTDLLKMEPSGW